MHINGRKLPRVDVWALRHLQVALASLGRLSQNPISTLMTAAVIGIALALPLGLSLLLNNVQQLSGTWDGGASISLFLKQEIALEEAEQLSNKLRARGDVARVRMINRDRALAEFRDLSGFAGALDTLESNPLPHLLIIEPGEQHSSPDAAAQLLEELQKLPAVDFAQLDLQWVRRLQGITAIAHRAVLILGSLLGLAVLLIVGNTIRLEIENRRREIEITKLIGGTNAFIRRPFLYCGLWYGLFGGMIAGILVTVSLWLLESPVTRLAGLYESQFGLTGMGFLPFILLLIGSSLLGLIGAWIAVGRHLSEIEPS